MDKDYIEAMNRIKASPRFKKRVSDAMREERDAPRRIRRRSLCAAAAVLVSALIVGAVLLIPKGSPISFSVAVSAAQGASELSDGVYTVIGEPILSGGGGAADLSAGTGGRTLNIGLDLKVKGKDIAAVTYEMSNGRIIVSDSSDKLIGSVGRSRIWSPDEEQTAGASAVEGASFYRAVTCDGGRQLTFGDDGFAVSFGCTDYGGVPAPAGSKMYADDPTALASEAEVIDRCNAELNRFFDSSRLTVAVSYADGRREQATVVFSADTTATLIEEKRLFYGIDADTGGYHIYHSMEEWRSDHGAYSLKGSITRDDAVRTDDRGGYRLTERPDGDEGQEYTLTFTDDDWITTYQWGVDCRLKAKII